MKRALLPALIVTALAACVPPKQVAQSQPAAQAQPQAAPAAEAATSVDDDMATLARADQLYDQGVESLKEGRRDEGRERFAEASRLLFSQVDDPALAADLRSDFSAMLEKVRAQDDPSSDEQPARELDASTAALAAAPETLVSSGDVKGHVIAIQPDNDLVQRFLGLYTVKRKRSVEEALGRAGRFRPLIAARLKEAGLPPELFWLVMTESEFKRFAVSRSGAAGLWQLMPQTARRYGLEVSFWVDERYDPEKATDAALRYLSDLRQWFGDWHLALAAYNRGEGGIGRDMTFTRGTDFKTLFSRGAMPLETREYVAKFMACVLLGEHPDKYGLSPQYEKPAAYDEVALDKPLDLQLAAKAAGTDADTIKDLNPEVRAWCTPSNRPGFKFRVPAGTKDRFAAFLAGVKDWNPGPSLVRYRVKRGDYLGKIAKRYRTSVRKIMALNKIGSARRLRPGMTLKIEPGRRFAEN